jgi:hypothetical protein
MYNLFWGDIHSHCSISYGHGSVTQALARARQQLDFCSVTGHAFWPDMPTDRDVYADIIDYHITGFARCARNWNKLLALQEQASSAGEFLALPSYEWHSLKYGDHNIYGPGPELKLEDAADLPSLRRLCQQKGAIAVPHHIGYAAGYRGIDWRHFREEYSPIVEIHSLHGCSESDAAPYPMLHDMGPRDAGSTAEAGWQLGHKFGIIGSTDHHSAYPGSHGDGRMGVFATALTRDAIWEAILARRVFAATGDRIDARLFVNDAWIGSEIKAAGERRLRVEVTGTDALRQVEVLKNDRISRRLFPTPATDFSGEKRYRLRITWGWGRKEVSIPWHCRLSLSSGRIISQVEPCFKGPSIVAPIHQIGDEEVPDDQDLPHAITEQSERECVWHSVTTGNLTLRHDTTQALALELEADLAATLTLEVNGQRHVHPLAELLLTARCHYLRGWLSEAVRIGPLVPLENCTVHAEWVDTPTEEIDRYRLRAEQANGQWVWLSPIWVRR